MIFLKGSRDPKLLIVNRPFTAFVQCSHVFDLYNVYIFSVRGKPVSVFIWLA